MHSARLVAIDRLNGPEQYGERQRFVRRLTRQQQRDEIRRAAETGGAAHFARLLTLFSFVTRSSWQNRGPHEICCAATPAAYQCKSAATGDQDIASGMCNKLPGMKGEPGMPIAELTIDARRLWQGEEPADLPLAFVNLEALGDAPESPVLPAYPLIGLGRRDHPFARHLDTVVEHPVGAESLANAILAMPRAAATIIELLRILPKLSLDDGLTAESLAYAMLQGSAEHRQWLAARAPANPSPPGRLALRREGALLSVTLDRPTAGNAIDTAMRDDLHAVFSLAAIDPEIERIVLQGKGRSFSLGAELAEFGTTTDPATAHAIRLRTLPARALLPCADRLETHVHAACVGAGLEIAAFSRRLTAASDAWFQLPEVAMGILPGAGGCVSLTRRIGRQRAALMMLSGKRIAAKVALDWGLIDAIVDQPPAGDDGADMG